MEEPRPDPQAGAAFEVGPWRAEPGLNRLVDASGRATMLEPRAMDVLVCLARHAGETVAKEQLLAEVWKGAYVVEGVVAKTVSGLRQALGDEVDAPRFILTVARRGYRLIAPVRKAAESTPEAPTAGAAVGTGSARWRWAWAALAGGALVAGVLLVRGRSTPDAAAARIERLAVAPFERAATEPAGEQLASALRSELFAELMRLAKLRVHLLESAQVESRGALGSARSIDADAVLLGSVSGEEERIRVDLQLVETRAGELLWTAAVERPASELYELRRQIATEVGVRLGATAPATRFRAAGSGPPVGAEAYRRYLEARFLWSRRGADDLERARELFETITREAPRFAEGFAWLALAEVTQANYVGGDPGALYRAADEAAQRALELDRLEPLAHVASGLVALNLRLAPGEAIASYRRAIELAPSFAPAHQLLAEALSIAERHTDAVAAADDAIALEPFSPVMHGVRGIVLHAAGRPAEALDSLDRALVLGPRFSWLHRYRAYALVRLGREREAASEFVDEARGQGEDASRIAALERAVAETGLEGYWRWRSDRLDELRARTGRVRPTQAAEALAGIGRDEDALTELARAPGEFEGEYFLHYRWSPAFDRVREDPRFLALYAGLSSR